MSDDGWLPYDAKDSKAIEQAFKKGQKTKKLNDTYMINFQMMIQVMEN